jgi:hypothetical protein
MKIVNGNLKHGELEFNDGTRIIFDSRPNDTINYTVMYTDGPDFTETINESDFEMLVSELSQLERGDA